MPARVRRRQLLATAGLTLLWPRSAWAEPADTSLAEMIAHSDCCVVGRSVAAQARWTLLGGARRIVTLHSLELQQVLAGSVRVGETLNVRTLGGVVGDLSQRVFGEAELAAREPALLFLLQVDAATHVVTDMAGGHFALRRDATGVRRLHATRAARPAIDGAASAVELLTGASLDEARFMIADAARGPRAR
jgi:hypothetical protein